MQYPPDHPRATTSLVLGILGIVACQVLAPFAWVIGKRTVAEIDAARGMVGGRSAAQAGYVMGVVGTALLGLSLLLFAVWLAILAVLALAPAP
jgi:predicted benzoate:H+ symporter BenE